MHWRRFKISSIPVDNPKAFDVWLRNRWTEKDHYLEHFARTGTFPADKPWEIKTNQSYAGKRKTTRSAPRIATEVKPANLREFMAIFAPVTAFITALMLFYGASETVLLSPDLKTAIMSQSDAIQDLLTQKASTKSGAKDKLLTAAPTATKNGLVAAQSGSKPNVKDDAARKQIMELASNLMKHGAATQGKAQANSDKLAPPDELAQKQITDLAMKLMDHPDISSEILQASAAVNSMGNPNAPSKPGSKEDLAKQQIMNLAYQLLDHPDISPEKPQAGSTTKLPSKSKAASQPSKPQIKVQSKQSQSLKATNSSPTKNGVSPSVSGSATVNSARHTTPLKAVTNGKPAVNGILKSAIAPSKSRASGPAAKSKKVTISDPSSTAGKAQPNGSASHPTKLAAGSSNGSTKPPAKLAAGSAVNAPNGAKSQNGAAPTTAPKLKSAKPIAAGSPLNGVPGHKKLEIVDRKTPATVG